MIDTIFLDAGGTLVWPNWQRISDILRKHGITVDASALAAADPHVRKALDDHLLIAASSDQRRAWRYFDDILAAAGVASSSQTAAALADVEGYQRTSNIWECVPEFVPATLAELRHSGYRLVVVSNANGTVRQAFARLGLLPLVDMVIDSAEERLEKPDPRLFDRALERSGARGDRTVHVGDFFHIDVAGARAAGLAAVLVDEADLYPTVDCPRITSIAELPTLLGSWSG